MPRRVSGPLISQIKHKGFFYSALDLGSWLKTKLVHHLAPSTQAVNYVNSPDRGTNKT